MTARKHEQHDPKQATLPELPARLAEDLRNLYAPPFGVPAEIDDDIIFAGHRQLSDTRRSLRWGAIAVVAAMILLVLGLEFLMQPLDFSDGNPAVVQGKKEAVPPGSNRGNAIAASEDIDGSGRIDILDAFRLARALKHNEPTPPACDINRDGRIDQADVDAIAGAAVRLGGGAS